jgi:hypothetical protein
VFPLRQTPVSVEHHGSGVYCLRGGLHSVAPDFALKQMPRRTKPSELQVRDSERTMRVSTDLAVSGP